MVELVLAGKGQFPLKEGEDDDEEEADGGPGILELITNTASKKT